MPPAAFGLLVHVCQFMLLTLLGLVFLSVDRISVRRLLQEMKKLRVEPDDAPATS